MTSGSAFMCLDCIPCKTGLEVTFGAVCTVVLLRACESVYVCTCMAHGGWSNLSLKGHCTWSSVMSVCVCKCLVVWMLCECAVAVCARERNLLLDGMGGRQGACSSMCVCVSVSWYVCVSVCARKCYYVFECMCLCLPARTCCYVSKSA